MTVTVEESTSRGRLDMAVVFNGNVHLFEFKVDAKPAGAALTQLRERDYAGKYRATGMPVHLIGVEFDSQTRSVVGFEVADAP